jgi:hypothetical protein
VRELRVKNCDRALRKLRRSATFCAETKKKESASKASVAAD